MHDCEVDISGAIDLHCHASPDPRRRRSVNAVEAAIQARAAAHKAIVLKSHDYPTAPLAAVVANVVDGIQVFGGICCDDEVGGLNPRAVEASLLMGAKVVWLPTHSAAVVDRGAAWDPSRTGGSLSILDSDERLSSAMQEILDLVKKHDAILATGHISRREHFKVSEAFATRGKVLVTHAREAHSQPDLSVADCRELIDLGAMIELSAFTFMGAFACRSPEDLIETVNEIGPAHCVVSTDFGQRKNPTPVVGLQEMANALHRGGVPVAAIRQMICVNPASLLGIA